MRGLLFCYPVCACLAVISSQAIAKAPHAKLPETSIYRVIKEINRSQHLHNQEVTEIGLASFYLLQLWQNRSWAAVDCKAMDRSKRWSEQEKVRMRVRKATQTLQAHLQVLTSLTPEWQPVVHLGKDLLGGRQASEKHPEQRLYFMTELAHLLEQCVQVLNDRIMLLEKVTAALEDLDMLDPRELSRRIVLDGEDPVMLLNAKRRSEEQ